MDSQNKLKVLCYDATQQSTRIQWQREGSGETKKTRDSVFQLAPLKDTGKKFELLNFE